MIIKLNHGKFTEIDDEDWEKVKDFKWYAQKEKSGFNKFYATTGILKEKNERKYYSTMQMQRFLLNPQKGMICDHIDGNPLNNKRNNLRICTIAQNAHNIKWNKRNKSGYKGVLWDKNRKKWMCQIVVKKIPLKMGRFKNIGEAALAYNTAAKQYYGEFASLNKIGSA